MSPLFSAPISTTAAVTFFFSSSRRRHTRFDCDGVQTCALPIFNGGRVIAADGAVSKPLTGLRGAHVSGGAVVWIVGDLAHMRARGFRPLGMEPLAVGTSSRSEEHTSELQSQSNLVCRLLLEKKK